MTPTTRTAVLLGVAALTLLLLPVGIAAVLMLAVAAAAVADAGGLRRPPAVRRSAPRIMARGVPADIAVTVETPGASEVRIRQPVGRDLVCEPPEALDGLRARLVATRRGRHPLPAPALRLVGPLGLGAWHHQHCGPEDEVTVYPDLPAARRLALAVRRGRFREPGRSARGPLGLGTEFDRVRDYLPDDDIRQVNWLATQRVGRPMSNQYRVEQDREVLCVLDTGRLMAAPIGDRTRLDAAMDAVAAVAAVADAVGDRCGVVAFDDRIRRRLPARRAGGDAVIRTVYDLEPSARDSDYELAFRTVGRAKRAFVLVLTDVLEISAARPLLDAVGVLARRHVVAVASVTDSDVLGYVRRPPERRHDVLTAAVALDVLDDRARVMAGLRRAGAEVIEAPAEHLGSACVRVYLRAKARARL